MGDGPEFYGRPWRDPERWRALTSGEACPICDGDGKPYGIVAELDASYLTTARDTPYRGYCCLVLKRHAVELHDLGDTEAFSLMGDLRRVSRALKDVTGAVKINVDIHGNTLPHLHAHFLPRYVGDPYEDGPIDFCRSEDTREFTYDPEEFRRFVEDLRAAVEAA
jgi:diadenosine tetraphosphate (Ap4A) HIT family hydrolase